jgi:hypothetical protein
VSAVSVSTWRIKFLTITYVSTHPRVAGIGEIKAGPADATLGGSQCKRSSLAGPRR